MASLHQQTAKLIEGQATTIASRVIKIQLSQQPDLQLRCRQFQQELVRMFLVLAQAIAAEQPLFLEDYVAWAKVWLHGIDLPISDFAEALEIGRQILSHQLTEEQTTIVNNYFHAGTSNLAIAAMELPGYITADNPYCQLAQNYLQTLLNGRRKDAYVAILQAFESGTAIADIYLYVFQPCLYEIGRLWQMNKISVAQNHFFSAATQLIMSQFYPHFLSSNNPELRLIAACISGNLHEIGIRMVADIMEMQGWDTHYIGASPTNDSIIEMVIANKAQMLAVSATLVEQLAMVENLITAVRAHPQCRQVKIIVGGRPFNLAPDLWRQLEADGTAVDAKATVALAQKLMEVRKISQ